ncbi:MAG: DUF799 family lipoprotein [Syntrophorhabdaceae bacterium]|nr:DUF799 family lipoprotein [Syntrophorhabdaceae bacterium]
MIRVRCASSFRFSIAALAVSAVLFAFGCAHKDKKPDPKPVLYTGPKVAVAPMENKSNYVSASDIIRDAFIEGVAERGYAVVPVLESDAALRAKLGISYGGQLPVTTPREVCDALGVEGVFYGEVQEFGKTTTGFYNSLYVAASFQLYGKDGSLLWEGRDRQRRQDTVRGNNGGLVAEAIVRGLGNILLSPLTPVGKVVGANIARQVRGDLLSEESQKPHKSGLPDDPKPLEEPKLSEEPKLPEEPKPESHSTTTSSNGKE